MKYFLVIASCAEIKKLHLLIQFKDVLIIQFCIANNTVLYWMMIPLSEQYQRRVARIGLQNASSKIVSTDEGLNGIFPTSPSLPK
jgi:hypothetical protein